MALYFEAVLLIWCLSFSNAYEHAAPVEHLLHSVNGEVGRGNYTYYSLMYEGFIVLYLHSAIGDADLYVSQELTKPTFEPDSYCLQSSTCGLDIVTIPSSFSRPVGIGVYGHISHEVSAYLLEVYYREEEEDTYFDTISDSWEKDISGFKEKGRQEESQDTKVPRYRKPYVVEDDEGDSFIWTLIWSFFDILVEVVFL